MNTPPFVALALCLGLSATDPLAAQDYPTQPIKVVVPAAAGGPSDFPARLASQILPPRLGQPVIVENRGGAGGGIGARAVAGAPPDGYTLMVGNTSTLAVILAAAFDLRQSAGLSGAGVRRQGRWRRAADAHGEPRVRPRAHRRTVRRTRPAEAVTHARAAPNPLPASRGGIVPNARHPVRQSQENMVQALPFQAYEMLA